MPIPDLSGVPPWASFDDHQSKLNDIVAKYNNLLVNLDSLNVVSLTADHIDAGTIDANVVTIRSDLNAGAFVEINGNGMRINNGSRDTFTADINGMVTMTGATIRNNLGTGFIQLSDQGMAINNGSYNTFTANTAGYVTMTGALIQSQTGYPYVIMDPGSTLFGAYSAANNYLTVQALGGTSQSPQVLIAAPNANMQMFVSGLSAFLGTTGANLNLTSNLDVIIQGRNIKLTPDNGNYDVIVPFDQFKDDASGRTLYQELLGKATSGSQTGLGGAANGGIAPGTVLQKADGGTVTWVGISAHTHTQN
ncbi:hypothetical protein [Paenibacillus sp. UASWS1643]|uniref:hypothetical protein n=1 Tax=Paenibacillus sp. UASWS1643 TaxID=2580422 RepID=UPI00123AEFC6|nr:hypothetical protein [Paenibacillus sp. UASWS1643]KAA8747100.1 hypothetical protein FE296_23220 [Paenibacillus sp. UASWS1643]